MRPLTLTAAGLVLALTALTSVQDGGLFGPPDRGGSRGGSRRGGARPAAPPEDQGPRTRGERDALSPEVIELGHVYFSIADYNGDGWISLREAKESLDMDRARFSRVDRNTDGRVDREEFLQVYESTVRQLGSYPPPTPDPEADPSSLPNYDPSIFDELDGEFVKVDSIEQLFGVAEARELDVNATRQPPFIAGPIPHFRRLDLDLDGQITESDLVELLRPIQVQTRIRAVIAIMDADESGGISLEEFQRAMGDEPPVHDAPVFTPLAPPGGPVRIRQDPGTRVPGARIVPR